MEITAFWLAGYVGRFLVVVEAAQWDETVQTADNYQAQLGYVYEVSVLMLLQ